MTDPDEQSSDSEINLRLDQAITGRGLVRSRTLAQDAIKAGHVSINGKVCMRSNVRISDTDLLEVASGATPKYVSRGGEKLAAALDEFKIDPKGLICMDIGASTGGFTDCLLQRSAKSVLAVDVGAGQMASHIASDSRVELREHVNARDLRAVGIHGPFELIVIDVSFISLTMILPSAAATLSPDGSIVALIKPQFEVGRDALGSGGIVRDEGLRKSAVQTVHACAQTLGLTLKGEVISPIIGGDGNIEYLAHYRS